MKDKRILYVSSEVVPYLPETEMASTAFNAARKAHSKGVQTRIFMPRFGVINERRHQLHEVIRLSGMNLIINDMDMPLIFIDNDEYFKRKAVFTDEDDTLFDDNDERAIFFAKGVIETVKKLNWAPDIIHIHGWMASLLPLYLREFYKEEPLFNESKIVTSVYNNAFEGTLNTSLAEKVKFDKIAPEKTTVLETPNHTNILKSAIENSDAVIKGSESLSEELNSFIKGNNKPVLEYQTEETLTEAYLDFYANEVLAE
jgi:starch synthase